jgi:hypothetical protein
MTLLSSKDPNETIVITFDFTPLMNYGESIKSIVSITTETYGGDDPNPENIILDQIGIIPSTNSMVVQQPIVNGLDGVTYKITVTVTTTRFQTLVSTATLPVVSQ